MIFNKSLTFGKRATSVVLILKFNRYENVTQGILKNKRDVLFYETGLPSVPDITNNTYLPGAIADHLTSYGGVLTSGGQMSVLSWLRAGATGSYGTVVEPCAYWQKFPTASAMFIHYFLGRTLLEAMWSSVWMPGQGLFVGEPLSSPFKGVQVSLDKVSNVLLINVTWLFPRQTYVVEAADGPYSVVTSVVVASDKFQLLTITVPAPFKPFYRIRDNATISPLGGFQEIFSNVATPFPTVPSNITDNSSTSPPPSDPEYSSNPSSVVGAVVGSCAGSAMVIGLVVYLKKRRRNFSSQNKNTVLQMNGSKNSILV
jgi:hypothetical protein